MTQSNPIVQLLRQSRPLVMGILNATPDSFSDGGRFLNTRLAVDHALVMQKEGADIIDIGGESTRPGAPSVTIEDEAARVLPVIEAIRRESAIAISVDTSKPELMRRAVEAGADMINDVNALQAPQAVEVCAELGVPVCVMHMQGQPRTMQTNPHYDDVVGDIKRFLQQRVAACEAAGIDRGHIMIDPGFGFGKTLAHNLSLLGHLEQFEELGLPLLVGMSRKSMLGMILDAEVDDRLYGSIAAAVIACTRGARIFRVHDVKPSVDALRVCAAVKASY
jgi:dihydropteroate synthase